jgi:SHS2 domain-containing protein
MYRYLEEVAPADVAFEAEAPTLSELFAEAWAAALGVMLEQPPLLPAVRRELEVSAEALDLLLFDFLGRLVYHKDADRLLLRAESVEVREEPGGWSVEAKLAGEPIDPARQSLGVDVKAVTLHRLVVERTAAGWRAVVVLDL